MVPSAVGITEPEVGTGVRIDVLAPVLVLPSIFRSLDELGDPESAMVTGDAELTGRGGKA